MHRCRLKEGMTGRCLARKKEGGVIRPLNYGRLTALALDPIEKKPLCRFYPGSFILSVGSYGCNLSCPFCQNSDISTKAWAEEDTRTVQPDELVSIACGLSGKGNIGLAFTYNEPLVGYEYVRDCSELAKKRGLKTVVVTNGSVCLPVLLEILPFIDAFNVDLKCFREESYRKLGGDLHTVTDFIRAAAQASHVEVTSLIVPGFNDSEEEMLDLAGFLASVDETIPLHVTRFFPRYRMADAQPTPAADVKRLSRIAGRVLKYVRTGNC